MLHHVLAHEPVVHLSLGFCELLEQELLLDDGVPYYQPITVTYPSTQTPPFYTIMLKADRYYNGAMNARGSSDKTWTV